MWPVCAEGVVKHQLAIVLSIVTVIIVFIIIIIATTSTAVPGNSLSVVQAGGMWQLFVTESCTSV